MINAVNVFNYSKRFRRFLAEMSRTDRNYPALLFFLLGIAVLLLPYSGIGISTMRDWWDQSVFLKALKHAANGTMSLEIRNGTVGAGYIAFGFTLQKVLGIGSEASLVLLNRCCFIITVLVVAAFAWRQALCSTSMFICSLMATSVVALLNTPGLYASDIPWTHFFTTALFAILVFFLADRSLTAATRWGFCGFLGALIMQTRAYEGWTLVIAGVIAATITTALRKVRLSAGQAMLRWASLTGGVAISYAFCYLAIGEVGVLQQYSNVPNMDLVPSLLPYRLVQLFIDPNFMTFRSFLLNSGHDLLLSGIRDWNYPLSLQLPALIAAMVTVAAFCIIVRDARELLVSTHFLLTLLCAGGLLVGYTVGAPTGSPHLKYGFFRDYMAPTVLFVMLWIMLSFHLSATTSRNNQAYISKTRKYTLPTLSLTAFLIICAGLTAIRMTDISGFRHFHLANLRMGTKCMNGQCSLSWEAYNTKFRRVSLPDTALVSLNCNDGVESKIVKLHELSIRADQCNSVTVLLAVLGLDGTPEGVRSRKSLLLLPNQETALFEVAKISFDTPLEFRSDSGVTGVLGEGWSSPEKGFTWSEGLESTLRLAFLEPVNGDVNIEVNGDFFITPSFSRNRALIFVDGVSVALWDSNAGGKTWYIHVPKPILAKGYVDLTFRYDDARSPASFGSSADTRQLAFALQRIAIRPAP